MPTSDLTRAVGWSSVACVLFGVQNYIIGFTNSIPGDDFCRTVGVLWFVAGCCGLALFIRRPSLGIFFTANDESQFNASLTEGLLKEESQPLASLPKLVTVAGGLAIGGAQVHFTARPHSSLCQPTPTVPLWHSYSSS